MTDRKVHIWLIHGTWARSAAWTRTKSVLRSTLEEKIDAEFHVAPWSGRNLMFQRIAASEALCKDIDAFKSKSTPSFVIGHSHGGNIGASVASHAGLLDGLITLNTPFLSLLPREMGLLLMQALMIIFGIHILATQFLHFGLFRNSLVSTAIFALLFIFFLVFARGWEEALMEYPEPTDNPKSSSTPALCIGTADDEALGWLQAIDTMLNLPYLLLHRIALPLSLLAILALHYFFHMDFAHKTLEFVSEGERLVAGEQIIPVFSSTVHLSDAEQTAMSKKVWFETPKGVLLFLVVMSTFERFLVFWALLGVVSWLASYLIRGVAFGSGFGTKELASAFLTRLTVTSVPRHLTHTESRSQEYSKGFVRHSSIYSDPRTLYGVADWINDRLAERD